jgi:hypothetical protein
MSVFRVNPQNILGLDHSKFKSQLLAMALAEPHTYFRLRDDVYTKIVENAVRDAYNLYWNILKEGRTGVAADGTGGTPITIETEKYKNSAGNNVFNFAPQLPESEINTFALEVAEAVKDIAERCIDKIMPLEIKDLAVRRSKELLPSSATGGGI